MVNIFGSNLYSAYTNGTSVTMIYTNGVKVWPDNPVPPGEYYVKWTPTSLSGSFIMGSETRWLQDYSGLYTGPFYSYGSRIYIDKSAFTSTGVVYIDTNVDVIDNVAFEDCTSLIYVSASACIAVGNAAFQSCTSLMNVNFPKCGKFNPYTFRYCTNLLNVSAPNITVIESGVFISCTNLHEIIFPKCRYVGNAGFGLCDKLSYVELGVCSVIGDQAFQGCSSLSVLQIGYSGVCSFWSRWSSGTNINTIYVPLEWVSAYQNTYSTMSSLFKPISNNE